MTSAGFEVRRDVLSGQSRQRRDNTRRTSYNVGAVHRVGAQQVIDLRLRKVLFCTSDRLQRIRQPTT
jgi:hypothetical protein